VTFTLVFTIVTGFLNGVFEIQDEIRPILDYVQVILFSDIDKWFVNCIFYMDKKQD